MITAKQRIQDEYGMRSFDPEKKIAITLAKLSEMMEKFAAMKLEVERSKPWNVKTVKSMNSWPETLMECVSNVELLHRQVQECLGGYAPFAEGGILRLPQRVHVYRFLHL